MIAVCLLHPTGHEARIAETKEDVATSSHGDSLPARGRVAGRGPDSGTADRLQQPGGVGSQVLQRGLDVYALSGRRSCGSPGSIDFGLEGGWIPVSEREPAPGRLRRNGARGPQQDAALRPAEADCRPPRRFLGRGRVGARRSGSTVEERTSSPRRSNGRSSSRIRGRSAFASTASSATRRATTRARRTSSHSRRARAATRTAATRASTDSATLNNAGAALTGGIKVGGGGALHFAVGGTYNDLVFQVGAVRSGSARQHAPRDSRLDGVGGRGRRLAARQSRVDRGRGLLQPAPRQAAAARPTRRTTASSTCGRLVRVHLR